nr:zinc-binding alcohol dehydrogenase [Acidobacteriota bacterium]
MKQLLQNYLNGEMSIHDVPAPRVRAGGLLVATRYSLISAGTERALVELARKSMIDKARSRPDLVKKVIDKARTEGVMSAYQKSMQKLDSLNALGYSSAGVVLDVGDGVEGFAIGAPVACAGIGYASHAETIFVPRNLAAPVPAGVDLAHASFTTVGAIALQGVRIADLRIGETAVVIGLGLIGLITVQILKAAGCHVVGIDLGQDRCDLAVALGCDCATTSVDDLPHLARAVNGGTLADAALVTAASDSDALLEMAADAVRDRGRVVVVGQVGMRVPRKAFYDKELSLLMSRSYGPGRYDRSYEENGVDYPISYVRWTENRNMQAFLDLVAAGKVQLGPLLTHHYDIDDAVTAYDVVTGKTPQPHLGIVIAYAPGSQPSTAAPLVAPTAAPASPPEPVVAVGGRPVSLGVVGAGGFAMGILLPALRETGAVRFASVVTRGG